MNKVHQRNMAVAGKWSSPVPAQRAFGAVFDLCVFQRLPLHIAGAIRATRA